MDLGNRTPAPTTPEANIKKTINRPLKRKRNETLSSSEDDVDDLPENMLETEKILNASAVKNNLDETSVRKILKKVVTNDHVLALVKLREEEEMQCGTEARDVPTKITRSKAKELMKVSPKIPWKIPVDLCPIKHIPVKTTPEVKALIAQELPDDEDDDEYEPRADEIPSDDDQVESCSDLESQPRTPATPTTQKSPIVVQDGPFKIPQTLTAKRKLDLEEEEATIARRTRSKLSLSSTPIEHIESTFIPPDDIPMPVDDDIWNEFLNECLNPAPSNRHEDDDEADPEYNVAADPDANDEDEENLSNSIIKISKKELNDLVTELFNFMPESTEDIQSAESLVNTVLTQPTELPAAVPHWEGKQEPTSDGETNNTWSENTHINQKINYNISVGKTEMEEYTFTEENDETIENGNDPMNTSNNRGFSISIQESGPAFNAKLSGAPLSLQKSVLSEEDDQPQILHVHVDPGKTVLPQQVLLFQQQLRQHIQLATSNFLQLYIHPYHWTLAPNYKEYLETFGNICESNPKSVANVCNLQPAIELIRSWEKNVSEDTPENAEIVKFYQEECLKIVNRLNSKQSGGGKFHPTYKDVIATSGVFLYPHLLPPRPYRPDVIKKNVYVRSEDELIALCLSQFWDYVEMNPELYKLRNVRRQWKRTGLLVALQLVAKHMFPWTSGRVLMTHLNKVKRNGDTSNPILRFLKTYKVKPVAHRLLPFNPRMTLYEHSTNEMPRIWVRHLAKKSKRFKAVSHRMTHAPMQIPAGVPLDFEKLIEVPQKEPLPVDFEADKPEKQKGALPDPGTFDNIQTNPQTSNVLQATNIYSVIQTSQGPLLVPLQIQNTTTVNTINSPVTTPATVDTETTNLTETFDKEDNSNGHCPCCSLMQKIDKQNQKKITEYFRHKDPAARVNRPDSCFCSQISHPRTTNRLKLFIKNYKCQCELLSNEIDDRLKCEDANIDSFSSDDIEFVRSYQTRLTMRTSLCKARLKNRIHTIFSQYDINTGDPVKLTMTLHKALSRYVRDVYTDFIGFLTPQQAENANVFKNYLASHANIVLRRIDEDVKNIEKRKLILKELKSILYTGPKNKPNTCQMCSTVLKTMDGYPNLARYWFSLFTHKIEKRSSPDKSISNIVTQPEADIQLPATETEDTPNVNESNDKQVNDERDAESSSSSDEENTEETAIEAEENFETNLIKVEFTEESTDIESILNNSRDHTENDDVPQTIFTIHETSKDPLITNFKTEIIEPSDEPMEINENEIKTEVEWRRDEDKMILEIIKYYILPQNRSGMSILEILNERDVYKMLGDSLTHKSLEEIKERVLYLLDMVLTNQAR